MTKKDALRSLFFYGLLWIGVGVVSALLWSERTKPFLIMLLVTAFILLAYRSASKVVRLLDRLGERLE